MIIFQNNTFNTVFIKSKINLNKTETINHNKINSHLLY